MVFSSTIFLFLFLPILLAIYFLIEKKYTNYVLLIASLFFYAWGEPKNVFLMIVTIIINYILGIGIEKYKNYAKQILFGAIIFDIGILFFFKYLNFTINTINDFFTTGISIQEIVLPIGISFYTFQIISYVVDVYRGKVNAQHNIIHLALYVSLFPQLIAGPIVRYIDIEKQINERDVTLEKFYVGVIRFAIGFSKKVLIADQLAPLVDMYFTGVYSSIFSSWIVILACIFQVYFDFSGYSDMAIGLGKMFGFDFLENFNYPYSSKSVQEIWQRWHISLMSWLKDYVYIPLGGSRCSSLRVYFNLFIVFLLTGFWHGASFTFVVWALVSFIFMILERIGLKSLIERLPNVLQHFYALGVFMLGGVFFRAETMTEAFAYIHTMFIPSGNDWINFLFIMNNQYWFCLFVGSFFAIPHDNLYSKLYATKFRSFCMDTMVMTVFFIAISYMIGSGFSPFMYFRF